MSDDSFSIQKTKHDPSPAHSGSLPPNRRSHPKPEISDHELLRCVGYGSYGEVWLARNIMGVYRAVKVVYRDTFDSDKPYDREFEGIKKFEPVSRSHESQVNVLHVGRNDAAGYFYYVMELADDAAQSGAVEPGDAPVDIEAYQPKTLRSELRRQGRIPIADCLDLAIGLAKALHHLHAHGLVHRDIKPSNIIFVNGRPKLADIGLVAQVEATVSFVGTEGFLPPEGPGKPQADIYGLGKVFYEIGTGKDRMQFPEPPTMVREHTDHELFLEFNEVIARACHSDASRRYQTAGDMHEDLLLLRAGKSLRRTRAIEKRLIWATKAGAVLVAAIVVALLGFFYQERQTREARRLARQNFELAQKNRELARAETVQREQAERERAAASRQRNRAEAQRIEAMLNSGETAEALATMAHLLRSNSSDQLLGRQLVSSLTYRNFAIPIRESVPFNDWPHDVHVSPVDDTIALRTRSSDVYLISGTDGRVLGHWNHPGVRSIHFSPDGERLVSAGPEVRVWQRDETSPQLTLQTGGHAANHAEFSPAGRWIVTGGTDGVVRVHNSQSGAVSFSFPPEVAGIDVVRFHPDGDHILSVAAKTLAVWNIENRSAVARLHHPEYKTGIGDQTPMAGDARFDPSGERVVFPVGGDSVRLPIWNWRRDEVLHVSEAHGGPIGSFDFSPDGRRVVTLSNDLRLRVWDLETGLAVTGWMRHGRGSSHSVAFSPNGELVASMTRELVKIWRVQTGEPYCEPIPIGDYNQFGTFNRDGSRYFVFSVKSGIVLDVLPGAAQPLLLHHDTDELRNGFVTSVKFDRSGGRLLTCMADWITAFLKGRSANRLGATPNYARVWGFPDGTPQTPRLSRSINSASFSPDQSMAATHSPDRGVNIWDLDDGTLLRQLRIEGVSRGGITGVEFSPDSRYVLVSRHYGPSVLFDIMTGKEVHRWNFGGKRWAPNHASISHDQKRIVIAGPNPNVTAVDFETGAQLFSFALDEGRAPRYVSFSPDDETLLVDAGSILIRNARNGASLAPDLTHAVMAFSPIYDAEFSSDGRYIVTASHDHTVRLWDAASGALLVPQFVHSWLVPDATISGDSSLVASGSWDRTARIWDPATGLPAHTPFLHPDWVVSVDFHPSGDWLATGCADGNAYVWEIMDVPDAVPEWLLDLAECLAVLRVDSQNNLIAHHSDLEQVRHTVETLPAEAPFATWGKWFFANRLERTISPSSPVSVSAYLDRLLDADAPFPGSSLARVLEFRPTDAEVLARVGRKKAMPRSLKETPAWEHGLNLTQLAVKRDPELPIAWWALAETLLAGDAVSDALAAVDEALRLDPDDANAWVVKALVLDRSGETDAAFRAFRSGIERMPLSSPSDESDGRSSFRIKTVPESVHRAATVDELRSAAEMILKGINNVNRYELAVAQWLMRLAVGDLPVVEDRLKGALEVALFNRATLPNPDEHPGESNAFGSPDLAWPCTEFELLGIPVGWLGRIRGHLTPPETGDYVFYFVSDDEGALYLSENDESAGMRLIAREPEWNGARQWVKRLGIKENVSAPQSLIEGRRYFVEALAANHQGGGHLGVAWRKVDQPAPDSGDPPISAAALSTPVRE